MRVIQTAANGGEVTPSLYGQVDLDKYRSAVRTAENMFAHAHGGLSNRPGTIYVGKALGANSRFIRFQFNVEQAYMLELNDYVMRVVMDGGLILHTLDTTDEWAEASEYSLHDSVNDGTDIYRCILAHISTTDDEPGVGDNWETYWIKDATLFVATPYAVDDIPLVKFTQSADTIYFNHTSYPPYTLSRTDHTAWIWEEIVFETTVGAPTGVACTAESFSGTAWEYSYKVSTTNAKGEESLPSDAATVDADAPNNWKSTGIITVTWDAQDDAVQYTVYKNTNGYYGFIGLTDADTLSFRDSNIEGDSSDGPQGEFDGFADIMDDWEEGADYEASDTVTAGSVAYTCTMAHTSTTDDEPGTGDNWKSYWRGCYPAVPAFFDQRMVYGGTLDQPQSFWCSQTGIFNNFSTANPLKDSDEIAATIVSGQVNEIRHFVPLTDLIAFTRGAIFKIGHGDTSDALTPSSVQVKIQGYRGCAQVPPLVIDNTALYLQRGAKVVRDLTYDLVSDSYTGNNLSVLAEHLTRNNPITSWAYQENPDSIVWCVRDDGVLLALTYMREHKVWAWSHHVTDGEFLDVCVLEGDDADETYFLVQREVGGESVVYIEQLAKRMEDGDRDLAWFVDCGLRYEGDPAKTISGLDHLEGKTITGLADGSPLPNMVVEGGQVTLPSSANIVTLGLPYTAIMETLNLNADTGSGTVQGQKKRVSAVTFRFEDSLGGQVGSDENHLANIKPPLPATWGEPPALRTEDVRVPLKSSWDTNGRLMFRQNQPLPVTILAWMPEVIFGG
ncbi:MAG: hypothetical protein AB7E51_15135 [Pseudodesulfovibrio sp.]|uniref:hypothetical protein n=1 Tax=Pseudodesulfovibrio sp. TaxID=2035812 RepID=UPI003D0F5806